MATAAEVQAQYKKDVARTAKERVDATKGEKAPVSDADIKAAKNAEANEAAGVKADPARNIVEGNK